MRACVTGYIGATSVPVTIPSGGYQRSSVSSLSQSPTPSPLGSLTLAPQHIQQQQKQEQQLQEVTKPVPCIICLLLWKFVVV